MMSRCRPPHHVLFLDRGDWYFADTFFDNFNSNFVRRQVLMALTVLLFRRLAIDFHTAKQVTKKTKILKAKMIPNSKNVQNVHTRYEQEPRVLNSRSKTR